MYQTLIDAIYNRVLGAEALVRWHNSETKKIVGPGDFISQAEQAPIIRPLTESLLRMAVSRCTTWTDPLSVSVNVPPCLLETDALIYVIRDTLEFYGLEPSRLVLEITERGELPASALQVLHGLRDLGLRVSIDDFGTGQCSLAYFRDLPADEIKIDQSFVQAMRTSKKDRAIVRGCIDLAHHCDMKVVAEGIEDAETATMLTELGCNVLQGYYFGKPAAPKQFEQEHLNGLTQPKEKDQFSTLLLNN